MVAAESNGRFMLYLARSSGLVALGLIFASVFFGLWLAGRVTRKAPTPSWVLDLHQFLGGLAVSFMCVHLTGVVSDGSGYGLAQILIPFTAKNALAISWGVLAFYLLVAIEVSSIMMKKLPPHIWRYIHMSSFVLFFAATVHAVTAGTDTSKPFIAWFLVLGAWLPIVALVVRLWLPRWKSVNEPGYSEQPIDEIIEDTVFDPLASQQTEPKKKGRKREQVAHFEPTPLPEAPAPPSRHHESVKPVVADRMPEPQRYEPVPGTFARVDDPFEPPTEEVFTKSVTQEKREPMSNFPESHDFTSRPQDAIAEQEPVHQPAPRVELDEEIETSPLDEEIWTPRPAGRRFAGESEPRPQGKRFKKE